MAQQITAQIIQWWQNLQSRERILLIGLAILVALMLVFGYHKQVWYKAIDTLQTVIPIKTADLAWMQKQAELLKIASGNRPRSRINNMSLLSVIEQTAKINKLRDTIVQMSPGENANQVIVNIMDVDFNLWLKWVDGLQKSNQVKVQQVNIHKKEANRADIKVTFERA